MKEAVLNIIAEIVYAWLIVNKAPFLNKKMLNISIPSVFHMPTAKGIQYLWMNTNRLNSSFLKPYLSISQKDTGLFYNK